ncbi:alpha/beta fold hydrolase [Myroides odoratimimus]|uniref:alpha/beta fold hydrolase n=1 Tax=Myroides odoratimimus TaxID=76832 RepID=UPI002DB6567F|nr:alpha/beta hydrolase [Myroides odoratimimus]MEC4084920.1 alpha/beta hydrolase [Myroides odoratimimus]
MRYSSYKNIGVLLFFLIQLFSFELFAQTSTEYFAIENTPLYQIKTSDVNLAIRYKKGQGIPIVFIHGSWDDHNSWLPVAEEINKTASNPIILYDRRGHSASSADKEQGTISIDVQDALSLLDALEIKKAHFIGHSYGANITIELANNHPDRVESIVLYEPPIFGILKGRSEYKDMLSEIQAEMQKSKTLLEQGHIEQGTFNFIEKVAFGKGSWYSIFDQRARNTMTASYATWLDQANDPERLNIKPENLNQFNGKITLITGSDSILVYPAVAKTIKQKVNSIELQTIQGAGHGGLISHPKQTADLISKHLEQL